MNSAKLTVGVAAVALVTAVGTYVHMDRTNAKLRSEVSALRKQSAQRAATAPEDGPRSASMPEADDLAKLRAEHAELMHLRSQITPASLATVARAPALHHGWGRAWRCSSKGSSDLSMQATAWMMAFLFREVIGEAAA